MRHTFVRIDAKSKLREMCFPKDTGMLGISWYSEAHKGDTEEWFIKKR